ncbi:MAG: aryl-sulfate sulfotransferase, partial [Pirellulaceae bacterium]|nr:aryl-sulfate sulfotransferase [Pirellulaceae bacterium]
MRNALQAAAIGVALALAAGMAAAYERLQGPTELLFYNKDKAFNGSTLFGVGSRTYLLDMEGRVVHTWPIGTNPHLLDNGNILDASKDDPSGFQGFTELDWDGKVVWEYVEKREGYAPHHDWVRIFNKQLNAPTTLYIANKSITHEQAIAAGADPNKGPYRDGQMDAVVEVDMQGNVVWEWWFFDHIVQDVGPAKPNYVGDGRTVADHPGRINLNLPGRPLKRDWLHCNSMDYNAESGHIVINSVQGELYVIDHDGTFIAGDAQASIVKAAGPAGDFLYRFGDPARYAQGDPPCVLENWDSATSGHKQMGGAHDVHWIRPGLAGAGHLMVFNNGQYLFQRTPHSSILEINPCLDASGRDTGRYVNPPDAGYRRETYDKDTHNQPRQVSNQIVWTFRSVNSHGFFSHIGSSAQRLPNGNTFICSDTEGHFFEVTAEGELVWEYINPVTRDGAVKVLGDVLPMTNSAFRAYRYGPDHPALQGRELTPQGTITQ